MLWLYVSQGCLTVAVLALYLRLRFVVKSQIKMVDSIIRMFQEQISFNAVLVEAVKPKVRKKAE